MSFLSVEQIYKSFTKEKKTLSDIHLDVKQGEIVALLGESGSGKTTLLRVIAGFERPDAGNLKLNTEDITYLKPEKRNIGMIFQDYALFPHLTVAENIKFGMHHIGKELILNQLENLLTLLKLNGLEKRYPHQISGGQQQRVAIARSLAAMPKLLLLDEPFSNLDKSLRDTVRKEVRNLLLKTQTTAIFVTHDIDDAIAVADKIVILKDGMIQQQGTYFDLYFYPTNEYVASICSPLQTLAINAKNVFLRPEAIHLSETATHFQATVFDHRFVGLHHEITCEIGNESFYFYHPTSLNKGEKVYLNIDEKLVWEFKKT
jgi:iron(III) transport system ATP-binding protein